MFAHKQDLPLDFRNEPETDTKSFMYIIEHDFPIEFLFAGELAQFETYGIPSIARLLHQTAQYEQDGLKRLDDTRATMYGIFNNPEGSAARTTMLDHLNWVHSHYQISNDDYLYTLLRMFFNPIEWIQTWGWRRLTEAEINGLTAKLVTIGKGMNIEFFSENYTDLYHWQKNYRNEHQAYSTANEAVTFGTIEGIKEHFPKGTRWISPYVVRAWLEDESVLKSLGLKKPNTLTKWLANFPRHGWKLLNKVHRPWGTKPFSKSWIANYFPSYVDNKLDYSLLGPRKLIKNRNAKTGCPFH